jgi:hypothetical protein
MTAMSSCRAGLDSNSIILDSNSIISERPEEKMKKLFSDVLGGDREGADFPDKETCGPQD